MKKFFLGVISTVVIIFLLALVFGDDKKQSKSNNGKLSSTEEAVPFFASPENKPSNLTLLSQNNPDIKHLSNLTVDYVGQTFTLNVKAETSDYYNYGFDDENSYYSLKLWDNSVDSVFDAVYGYIDRSNPNSKSLVEKLLDGSTLLRVEATIPTAKWRSGSNAFLYINSWEEI